MRSLAVTTLALLLAGCASQPADVPTAMEVSSADLPRYWTVATPTVSMPAGLLGNSKPMATHVVVAYTIDANGKVRDAEVASFSPEGSSPSWAVTMVGKNRFTPGPENPGAEPVRTTAVVTLNKQAPVAR